MATGAVELELSRRQRCAVRAALAGRHLFVTGGAGCGKSATARAIVEALREKLGAEKVAVTAPTGLAAASFAGATSLHRFAGVGLARGSKERLAATVRGDCAARRRWMRCKVLVIDEVSQLSASLLDTLSFVARKVRPAKLGKRAFGGIQLVLIGDFAQLPPVKPEEGFAFEAETWKQVFEHEQGCIVHLDKCFRVRDKDQSSFLQCLNELRMGDLSPQAADWLRDNCPVRVSRSGSEPTYLCARNTQVDSINERHLRQLAAKGALVHDFIAEDEPAGPCLTEEIDRASRLPRVLRLAVGAPVILLASIDPSAHLVNGVRGTVSGFEKPDDAVSDNELVPVVEFNLPSGRSLRRRIEPFRSELPLHDQYACIQASRSQIPLALAFAMTIHKAQGLELDHVRVDMDGIFSVGQAYTALTRTRSYKDLEVENLDEDAVRVHPKVIRFHRALFDPVDDLDDGADDASAPRGPTSTIAARKNLSPMNRKRPSPTKQRTTDTLAPGKENYYRKGHVLQNSGPLQLQDEREPRWCKDPSIQSREQQPVAAAGGRESPLKKKRVHFHHDRPGGNGETDDAPGAESEVQLPPTPEGHWEVIAVPSCAEIPASPLPT